ncbi:exonuclease family protein [Trichomonas vaginalis G3]|uniref:Exonuclease family protein n=1 Tax=Trichomonas vaginalis (strain ATCC PRA-98 / G3) TaxID=412133 RepID=A2D9N2_TRIV3|nr:exonuclease protein [Trichomonas vaginalis G3]EAY22888.1 exonuclease family protein [Trichomonas vaginalis G3]KAI5527396.1 exonuclease protein [Trichomonas vaginalis G3]|eukprot:XP_001583874.1 exonuclease family protein [Trichomonas vaginalis G3]
MKNKKQNTTYFDIFGKVQTEVGVQEDSNTTEISPMQVRNFALSIFNVVSIPKWAKIEHSSLAKRVIFLYFNGIDLNRYNKYFDEISNFHSMKENGFPVTVLASLKGNRIVPPEQSLLGYAINPKELKCFSSFDEMLLSDHKLLDNGFPLPEDPNREDFQGKHRFEEFGIKPLTPEELSRFKCLPDHVDNANKVIALDCEMIETTSEDGAKHDELARLSVVNEKGEVIIDEYFKPIHPVSDLRTHVSGITQEHLDNAKLTSEDGVSALSAVADKETIIVGHGLENDFKALLLFHTKVVDTSLIYNNERGVTYPRKPKLSNLFQKYFKKEMRDQTKPHDSIDDARAALELSKFCLNHAVSNVPIPPKIPDMFSSLLKAVTSIDVLAHERMINFKDLDPRVHCILEDEDEPRKQKLMESVKNDSSEFVFAYFNGMSRCEVNEEEERKAAKFYNDVLGDVLSVMPKSSVLIVYSGGGSTRRISELKDIPAKNAEMNLCKQGLLWAKATPPEE